MRAVRVIPRTAVCVLMLGGTSARSQTEPACPGGAAPVVIFNDDFETDQGWISTFEDDSSLGQWVRVDPIGTGAQPEDDHTPRLGVRCYVTGNGTGPPSAFDVDGGPVYLTSPPLNLVGDGMVSYWRWFHWGGNGTADFLTVQVSHDNGDSWTSVEVVAGSPPTGWQMHTFRVSDFVAPSATVRVRFMTSDVPNDSITEAALDDFLVTRCGVLGDLDGDGDLDLADWQVLAPCVTGPNVPHSPACAPADLDADGRVDLRDFRLFQNGYTGSG